MELYWWQNKFRWAFMLNCQWVNSKFGYPKLTSKFHWGFVVTIWLHYKSWLIFDWQSSIRKDMKNEIEVRKNHEQKMASRIMCWNRCVKNWEGNTTKSGPLVLFPSRFIYHALLWKTMVNKPWARCNTSQHEYWCHKSYFYLASYLKAMPEFRCWTCKKNVKMTVKMTRAKVLN